jgi:DNA-binding transcriptional ArsR family regulator
MRPERLSKVIHERVRLAMLSALAARGALTFGELKELLDVTDGNLSVHASLLEKHGLVRVKKEFSGRKPRTTFSLTREGRREFKLYVEELEKILRPA